MVSTEAIERDPRFQALRRERDGYGWRMTAIMLAVYYGFILLVAFAPKALAVPVATGWAMSWGFPIGVGVILCAVVMTGLYVYRSNGEFDARTNDIIEGGRQ
jgi:uncharacterized membrane protein (DUF485 family)